MYSRCMEKGMIQWFAFALDEVKKELRKILLSGLDFSFKLLVYCFEKRFAMLSYVAVISWR